MQVVILCGGQGTRIRDVTDNIPKPMIPIGGMPILWHLMKAYAHYGFSDFVLCLGYKSWDIKRFFLEYQLANSDLRTTLDGAGAVSVLQSYEKENWTVTLAETGLDNMTGSRVKQIAKYVRGDTFMMTYGDGLSDVNIHDLLQFHRQHGRIGTVTAVRAPGRFGEIEICGRQILSFQEKPVHAPGRVSGGFFVFNRDLFARMNDDESLIFEHEPLMGLARDGELMAYEHDGFWHPMDNSRDYQFLNGLWKTQQAPWASWQAQVRRVAA